MLIVCFMKLSIQTFEPLIIIYRRGNFVYQHCGYASVHEPVSYPVRSLNLFNNKSQKRLDILTNSKTHTQIPPITCLSLVQGHVCYNLFASLCSNI